MPHINFNNDFPGIRSAMAYSPETAEPMGVLAEIIMRSNVGLSPAEREIIGMYVSHLNDCFYCHHSHAEIACIYLSDNRTIIDQIKNAYTKAAISDKLKSLLNISSKVQKGGKHVTKLDIEQAKSMGASDKDIHDTVLISAAFCMFNRYVDGLDTTTPMDMSSYPIRAMQIVEKGYGSHVYSKNKSE
ncbi:MAG: peroxidase-related enzyme [Saprospiraceae bacterium]